MSHDDVTDYTCTICEGPFNLDTEGGIRGEIGILPVSFCVTCLTGIMDMADQLRGFDEDGITDFDSKRSDE